MSEIACYYGPLWYMSHVSFYMEKAAMQNINKFIIVVWAY